MYAYKPIYCIQVNVWKLKTIRPSFYKVCQADDTNCKLAGKTLMVKLIKTDRSVKRGEDYGTGQMRYRDI